jgi:hypothetical protein
MQQLNGTIDKVILPNINRRHISKMAAAKAVVCAYHLEAYYIQVYIRFCEKGHIPLAIPMFWGPGSQRQYRIFHLMLP